MDVVVVDYDSIIIAAHKNMLFVIAADDNIVIIPTPSTLTPSVDMP